MKTTQFLNEFQKSSSENANIGYGTFLGIETYTKKGVAQLTKDTTRSSISGGGSWTGLGKYIVCDTLGTIYVVTDDGTNSKFYQSSDNGVTFTAFTHNVASVRPMGLVFFPDQTTLTNTGFLFMFGSNGEIYYNASDATAWTKWSTIAAGNTWSGASEASPIIFPNDNFIYFGNGNQVGKIGFGTAAIFNPAGVSGTDYFYAKAQLTLPVKYIINCLSFLPSNYLALGTTDLLDKSGADLILWNPTLSTYETPLRLYSRPVTIGVAPPIGGIVQIINRNNILYCVTRGNHSIFSTNGTQFSLLADISLRSNIRKTTGAESNLPVFFDEYPMAINVLGNKLLTGYSIPTGTTYPANYGLYPFGLWSVAFGDSAAFGEASYGLDDTSIQCEFPLSNDVVVATSIPASIGCIFAVSGNTALISWQYGNTYGVDYIETNKFQTNIDTVMMESPMMEIGKPLDPSVVQNIQFNFTRNILANQQIAVYYRTGFDKDFALVTNSDFTGTYTGDGTSNNFKITKNAIGPTQYIQFQIRMCTGTDTTATPQLRTITIN